MYEVEVTQQFRNWWEELDEDEQESCRYVVDLLERFGPALSRHFADTLRNSRFPNMKELRIQHGGKPYRIFFAFDPRRTALLLLGGVKSDQSFYKHFAESRTFLCSASGRTGQPRKVSDA